MAEISLTGNQMLVLLELIAFDEPRTTAELALAANINRTVAYRLLATLHERGYVSRVGKAFTLGPLLSQMALLAEATHVPRVARPILRKLSNQIGECVVMHRISGDEAVVIDQAVSEAEIVQVHQREGARHSLALGASGLAVLAWQSDRTIRDFVVRAAEPDTFRSRLDRIRTAGYAKTINELRLGIAGIAVPLFEPGEVVRYSLAILVPSQRAERLDRMLGRLLDAKGAIEREISEERARIEDAPASPMSAVGL